MTAAGEEKQIESPASTADRSSAMEIDLLTKSMSALRFVPASVTKRLNSNDEHPK